MRPQRGSAAIIAAVLPRRNLWVPWSLLLVAGGRRQVAVISDTTDCQPPTIDFCRHILAPRLDAPGDRGQRSLKIRPDHLSHLASGH